jgi:O-antigen ligase/tetratricopeptide (TPR) repeat protein
VQAAGLDPLPWTNVCPLGDYVRPAGALGHPNFLGAYLAMAFPVTVLFAVAAARQRRWPALVVLTLAAVGCWVGIVLTLSRGAWLGLAAACAVLLAGWLCQRGQRRLAVLLFLLPLATAALIWFWGEKRTDTFMGVLRHRMDTLSEASSRVEIWRAGLATFRDYPLAGSGLDTFALTFPERRSLKYWELEWGVTPARAHNEAIHVLATQGLLGGAALLLLLGGLAAVSVRALRRAARGDRPLVLALVAAAAGFVAQSVVGFTVASTGVLFVTLAAMLSRFAEASPDPETECQAGRSRWLMAGLSITALLAAVGFAVNFLSEPVEGMVLPVLGLVVVVLAGLAVSLLRTNWAEREAQNSPTPVPSRSWLDLLQPLRLRCAQLVVWAGAAVVTYLLVVRPCQANLLLRAGERSLEEQPARALVSFFRAASIDPLKGLHWTKVSAAALASAQKAPTAAERASFLIVARKAMQEAVALEPRNAHHYNNLGQCLGRLAQARLASSAEACAAHEEALKRDPKNVLFCFDAANTALRVGELAQARQYAAAGLRLAPDFAPLHGQLGYLALAAGRPQEAVEELTRALAGNWRGQRHEHLAALSNLAAAYFHLGRYEDALHTGRRVLTAEPGLAEVRCYVARALELLQRPDEARQEYLKVLERNPRHAPARAALARLQ